jgi:hypothetical protein
LGTSNVILTIVGCPAKIRGWWKKTVVVCTLKRGAEAPREVLPIVSRLSADS